MVRYDKTLKPQEGKVGKSKGPTAKTPDLLAVGYHQPLPSEKTIRFRFEFASPRSEPGVSRVPAGGAGGAGSRAWARWGGGDGSFFFLG